jgi:hypothetical protein
MFKEILIKLNIDYNNMKTNNNKICYKNVCRKVSIYFF